MRDLAGDLLVSLITVRRAYADLVSEGLIIQIQGQGTFVANHRSALALETVRHEAKVAIEESIQKATKLGVTKEEIKEILTILVAEKGAK